MGKVRVDNIVFTWMGYPPSTPGQESNGVQKDVNVCIPRFAWVLQMDAEISKFTSTKTITTVTCGSVDVTATFLSPVEVCTPTRNQVVI